MPSAKNRRPARPERAAAKQRGAKVRFRLGMITRVARFLRTPLGTVLLALCLIASVVGGVVYNHFYWKFSAIIDLRLDGGAFDRTARYLAIPRIISVGDQGTLGSISKSLRAAGYTSDADNAVGWYELQDGRIRIHPGPLSHFRPDAARISVQDGRIAEILLTDTGERIHSYQTEPELITNQFDQERTKRRLFKFSDYPQHLIDAVIAIEDHRFYSHWGIDWIRTAGAAIEGLLEWKRPRGTSTLTQQLARNFFLTRETTVSRKLAEAMIAVQLEKRLTKQQIFENYANQIFMGRQGSFNVHGFGEAARSFFDKDVRDVTLPEAAMLAGLPQGPSYLNPYRYPDRAKLRRNQVLAAMLREKFIGEVAFQDAVAAEIELSRGHTESRDAPYYIDLVNKSLQGHFDTDDLVTKNFWVYTTLDKRLQEFAVEAVREGMQLVDERIARQSRFRGREPPRAQVALVAMDPRTGEIKAVVGGRDYGGSQLNRALAKRQPGSVFKPFVYAAALDTVLDRERQIAIDRGYGDALPEYARVPYAPPPGVLTPSTLVLDEPTSFEFSASQPPYTPSNHLDHYYGLISLRYALMRSINVAAVKVGEMAGYQRVIDLARRAGMGSGMLSVPSLFLGTYEVTPVEVAAAYSAFANRGVRVAPRFVRYVRDDAGEKLYQSEVEQKEVLDTRVAYMVTHIMQDVIQHGSGIRARVTYGITNAAGKTGTDDDGWFAGFTNDLICVVWVGFDDNTDLGLEGAHSALPIWSIFMQKVGQLQTYANPGPFREPEGVLRVPFNVVQRVLADNYCESCTEEVYIAGTEPRSTDMLGQRAARRRAASEADSRPKRGLLGRVIGAIKGSGSSSPE